MKPAKQLFRNANANRYCHYKQINIPAARDRFISVVVEAIRNYVAVISPRSSDNFRSGEGRRQSRTLCNRRRKTFRSASSTGLDEVLPVPSIFQQHPDNSEYSRYPRQAQFARLTRRLNL